MRHPLALPLALALLSACPATTAAGRPPAGLAGDGAPPEADAGARVDRLAAILRGRPPYKVRLQVVLGLGRLKDRRAVPVLVSALADPQATVRAMAASALGGIGDSAARPALARLAAREKNGFVRAQATRALARLPIPGAPRRPPPGSRFYVVVGRMANPAGEGGDRLAGALGRALVEEFGAVRGVFAASGAPLAAREVRRLKMKAYVLDGAIVSFTRERRGASVAVSCTVRISVATLPGQSMKAFFTGSASTELPAEDLGRELTAIRGDLVQAVARQARKQIVRTYLARQ